MLGYSTHLDTMPEESGARVAAKAGSRWGAECTLIAPVFAMDVCCGHCCILIHQDGNRRNSILGKNKCVTNEANTCSKS